MTALDQPGHALVLCVKGEQRADISLECSCGAVLAQQRDTVDTEAERQRVRDAGWPEARRHLGGDGGETFCGLTSEGKRSNTKNV